MHISFEKLFSDVANELKPIVNGIDISIFARHNRGYERHAGDLMAAFVAEKRRYKETFDFINQVSAGKGPLTLLDVGTLIGILPVLLSKLGIEGSTPSMRSGGC